MLSPLVRHAFAQTIKLQVVKTNVILRIFPRRKAGEKETTVRGGRGQWAPVEFTFASHARYFATWPNGRSHVQIDHLYPEDMWRMVDVPFRHHNFVTDLEALLRFAPSGQIDKAHQYPEDMCVH